MTDASIAHRTTRIHQTDAAAKRRRRRRRAEMRFRAYGLTAIFVAAFALVSLLYSITGSGYTAFRQNYITIEIPLNEADIDPAGTRDPDVLRAAGYRTLVRNFIQGLFPDVTERRERRKLFRLISSGAEVELRNAVLETPSLIGATVTLDVPLSDDIDMLLKGYIDPNTPETDRRVSDREIEWLNELQNRGLISNGFNWRFFYYGDSREPELAGMLGAIVGSLLTMLVTLVLSFPVAVAAAIYLEEFSPKNRFTDLIEVNINNLAAVPSIVFGLLGLAVFINVFGLPRSAPLVGGMVLALMTLPTIIIAARASLKAVPPSIREGALGVGASPVQAVFHHVLPLAMPGIMTGTIIGMAQALGETAPLLMIGMVAFVADIPSGITSPAAALPVQIFLWADSAERAFVERTSAAIIVLLGFLILMNLTAILLRQRFEKRW